VFVTDINYSGSGILTGCNHDHWSLPVHCRDVSKKKDVRIMNIEAAKAVADAIRTSLGPRGMDKMVRCFF